VKCEIFYNLEDFLLDGLINLNAILPMILESNSLTLLLKFYKIYVKTVLKVSLKAQNMDAEEYQELLKSLQETSSLAPQNENNVGS